MLQIPPRFHLLGVWVFREGSGCNRGPFAFFGRDASRETAKVRSDAVDSSADAVDSSADAADLSISTFFVSLGT